MVIVMDKIYLVDLQEDKILDGGYLIYTVGSRLIYISEQDIEENDLQYIKMLLNYTKTLNEDNIIKQRDMLIENLQRIISTNQTSNIESDFERIKKQIKVVNRNGILKVKVFTDEESMKRYSEVKKLIENLKKL